MDKEKVTPVGEIVGKLSFLKNNEDTEDERFDRRWSCQAPFVWSRIPEITLPHELPRPK